MKYQKAENMNFSRKSVWLDRHLMLNGELYCYGRNDIIDDKILEEAQKSAGTTNK